MSAAAKSATAAASAVPAGVKAVDTKVHTFDFARVSEYARVNVAGFADAEKSGALRAYQFTHGQSNPKTIERTRP